MNIIETPIPGAVIIQPDIYPDARGYFCETWTQRRFNAEVAPDVIFVQDNESRSQKGVIRGLHFQKPPFAQAKLVRCITGRVLDIAVDLRKGSPAFGKHIAVELSADNHRQLFLPRGLAHGFAVLADDTIFAYKCDNYYAPLAEGGINPFDPQLNIDWPFDKSSAILSEKDLRNPLFSQFTSPFTFNPLDCSCEI